MRALEKCLSYIEQNPLLNKKWKACLAAYQSVSCDGYDSTYIRQMLEYGVARYLMEDKGLDWQTIVPLTSVLSHRDLPDISGSIAQRMAIVKLNGGLGTSMGCDYPKGLVSVLPGQSFMDIVMDDVSHFRQEQNVEVPLFFLSSVYTHDFFGKWAQDKDHLHIVKQHLLPRLHQSDLLPFESKLDPLHSWSPPGHGDVFSVLDESGYLDRWLAQGIEYVFISNIDNILATPCMRILGYLLETKCPLLMEVASRGALDKKGGALVLKEDQLHLLERAQVSPDHIDAFEDIQKFPFFNTNNIWVNIRALKSWLKSDHPFLTPIYNPKVIEGTPIYQLETAMGSLIEQLPGSQCLHVERNRFFPVKNTSDLLACRAFSAEVGLSQLGSYTGDLPQIQLSEEYRFERDFSNRILVAPSMSQLKSFKLDGPLKMGENVILKGDVWIESRCEGYLLEDQVLDNAHYIINENGDVAKYPI